VNPTILPFRAGAMKPSSRDPRIWATSLVLALNACAGSSSDPGRTPEPEPETCAACQVAQYTCGRSQGESFFFVPGARTKESCVNKSYPAAELRCVPLEICGPKACSPVTRSNETLTWVDGEIRVTCYPD
jgi:hypothetical protein